MVPGKVKWHKSQRKCGTVWYCELDRKCETWAVHIYAVLDAVLVRLSRISSWLLTLRLQWKYTTPLFLPAMRIKIGCAHTEEKLNFAVVEQSPKSLNVFLTRFCNFGVLQESLIHIKTAFGLRARKWESELALITTILARRQGTTGSFHPRPMVDGGP